MPIVNAKTLIHPTALTTNAGTETDRSYLVTRCQICEQSNFETVLFVGYLPPVNTMPPTGTRPVEQPAFPAELLRCTNCELFQLGLVVDKEVLFPPSYPYTSGTTKILRDNFAEMYAELMRRHPLSKSDLCVDIGSNDGTLLSNFHHGGHRTCGIEPTDTAKLCAQKGIPVIQSFFTEVSAEKLIKDHGNARIVTATNVFAHIDRVHDVVKSVQKILTPDGIFISESHYLLSLLETVQYDTIYHEHLRYYSLSALKYLFEQHDMEVIYAKKIPTHGGSIRVYAARRGTHSVDPSVAKLLKAERSGLGPKGLARFRDRVTGSKLGLYSLLKKIKADGGRVFGVGAPSRASTLINYVGLDVDLVDCVTEVPGSYKIGKNIPGTLIPVVDEKALYAEQPEYALLLSWHIADELMPKLTAKGFKGDFLVPLPDARIVKGKKRRK